MSDLDNPLWQTKTVTTTVDTREQRRWELASALFLDAMNAQDLSMAASFSRGPITRRTEALLPAVDTFLAAYYGDGAAEEKEKSDGT